MQIVNLDTGSYLRQTSAKALATAEKEKKDKYLHPCLEHRRYFTPMVYSADGIPGTEAVVAKQRLALLISNKLEREYFGDVWLRKGLYVTRNSDIQHPSLLWLHGQVGVHLTET